MSVSSTLSGQTTLINVNRNKLLESAFDEYKDIQDCNLLKTLEVEFLMEKAQDLGGPRREFFRLILKEIENTYFENNNVKSYLVNDYKTVGKILGMSMLQSGPIPYFLPHTIVKDVFSASKPTNEAVASLRHSFQLLGLYQLAMKFPTFLKIFTNDREELSRKALLNILVPKLSIEGTNKYKFETEAYDLFCTYIREVASGRREKVTLGIILSFVTGSEEVPLLGFDS